jgi:hypothetical protein
VNSSPEIAGKHGGEKKILCATVINKKFGTNVRNKIIEIIFPTFSTMLSVWREVP